MFNLKFIIMRKLLSLILVVFATSFATAQSAGDWYMGTGSDATTNWSDWSLNANVGYGIADDWMGGMSYSRSNDGADMAVDLYCRHFFKGLYAQGSVSMNTDGNAGVGVALGKMFMWGEHLYLDPHLAYNAGGLNGTISNRSTNLGLGLGVRF
jgi:hypothetical protein